MKKSQYLLNSLIIAFALFFVIPTSTACKRKKKKQAQSALINNMKADTIQIVRAPGVKDQASMDSLKKAKMLLKKQASASNMVVSFTSHGEGVDRKAFADFESFIKKYKPSTECTMDYKLKSWGREGEKDYCITSSYPECMVDFKSEVIKRFSGNKRVLIQENTFCRE